jgi:Flp pilus assembly protein TadG
MTLYIFKEAPRGNSMPRHSLIAHRTGAISIMFATMIIPLLIIVGLAVDFGFYVRAQAQLNLAADSAAMHAVRAAALAAQNNAPSNTSQTGGSQTGNTSWNYAGVRAGEEWFTAQATLVKGFTSSTAATTESSTQTGSQSLMGVAVTVTYNVPKYTATVTYSGTMNTIFGKIAGVKSWPIAGTATSVIGYNYVDIGIMIDNSQSMLIGATTSDINAMMAASPCYVVKTENGVSPGLAMSAYSYYLNGPGNPYGQGTIGYGSGQTLPTYSTSSTSPNPSTQYCVPGYVLNQTGLSACAYPPSILYGTNAQYYTTPAQATQTNLAGSCNNGGGAQGAAGPHTPQAPCAFACHQNADGGDWYAMARALTNPTTGKTVQLRLDVVQSAAQQVIQTMIQYSPPPQTLLGVGIYTFNTALTPQYPCTSLSGCTTPFGTDLTTALGDLAVCSGTQSSGCLLPPVSGDSSETYYATVFPQVQSLLGTSGDGSTAAKPLKNLFIVTDGINDSLLYGTQIVGPMDQAVAAPCAGIKANGVTVYVLYTPYLPIPTWTYDYTAMPAYPGGAGYPSAVLNQFVTEHNPASFPNYNASYEPGPAPGYVYDTPVMAALRACASSPGNFYTASNPADISTAMQAMLSAALNSAARVTQ